MNAPIQIPSPKIFFIPDEMDIKKIADANEQSKTKSSKQAKLTNISIKQVLIKKNKELKNG